MTQTDTGQGLRRKTLGEKYVEEIITAREEGREPHGWVRC